MLGRRALAQAARRATGSRSRRPDRLSARRARRTIRPRARRAPACGAVVPGALQRARRAGPHVPLPVTRAASTRWPAWPLAGNGLLPSPGLSSPASLRFAGAPRTPPGRCRALHITRALCATGARGARTNSPRAGARRRGRCEARAPETRRSFVRAFGAGAEGASRAVRCFRARHLRFSSLRVLDPARGHGPRRAPGLARACPRAWVEDRSPAENRKGPRAEKARAVTGREAARATRAHRTPPGGLHSAPVM